MPQPPDLPTTQSCAPLPTLSLPVLPPQVCHLRQRQGEANRHGAQAHRMPERVVRGILLQVDEGANECTAVGNANNDTNTCSPHVMGCEIIACPADDHGRALEDADSDEERAGVARGVVLRGNEHDVADCAHNGAAGDEGTACLEPVREVCARQYGEEGGHVGWGGEELRGGGVVAHTGNDGGEEERERVKWDLQPEYQ